jgi:alpha-N-acetylglucosaminidase
MNRIVTCKTFFIVATILVVAFCSARSHAQTSDSISVKAAHGVLERLLGERAKEFVFEKIDSSFANDVFEVEASHGVVKVRGSSATAMTRGAYYYLKTMTHSQVTWSGKHLNFPEQFPAGQLPFPSVPKTRISSPYKFRLYYNVCAYGYSTAFWNWDEWEKELDWMALHGINMPLAMAGQEAIWQKVWNSYGVSNDELKDYFTGPAFLPWNRMGNVNKHDGPLPQGWIDQNKALQKKILARMRELGMEPVVPAFAGFVPPAFEKHNPSVGVKTMAPWCGFDGDYRTHILSPKSPLFVEIGKKFIEEYRKEYGQFHYYLSDSFNEMDVPVSDTGKYRELADYGDAVYKSIVAGDPTGTWVMQGWLFYDQSTFWDTSSVQALLSKIPNDRMIIIDLANELWHGWKVHHGFYGKQWIYSVIHDFGGNNALFGPLEFFATDPVKMRADSTKGNLVGFGISPEGIENNEVVYELLTDDEWASNPNGITLWLRQYSTSRYGDCPVEIQQCWKSLLKSTYTKPNINVRFAFQMEPSLNVESEIGPSAEFTHAVDEFVLGAHRLGGSELYRNDLVELVTQYAGISIDGLLRNANRLHRSGDTKLRDTLAANAIMLMKAVDKLLASRDDRRLEHWLADARQWGNTDAEKNYYEADAKRQVTVWGGPELSEYAAKLWSGLVRDYYAERWRLFYQHLAAGDSFDMKKWQEQWITTPNNLSHEERWDDLIKGSFALKGLVDSLDILYSYPVEIEQQFIDSIRSAGFAFTVQKPGLEVHYTLDGTEPLVSSTTMIIPYEIRTSAVVKARAFLNDEPFGRTSTKNIDLHRAFGKPVSLVHPFNPKYPGGGPFALTDGLTGTTQWSKGHWQGFLGDDLIATVDLEEETEVHSISVQCLQDEGSRIFFPTGVTFSVSDDGERFREVSTIKNDIPADSAGEMIHDFSASMKTIKARYVRVKAENIGVCPKWHSGAGNKAWLFVDEIMVE